MDLLTAMESDLMGQKLRTMLVPSQQPVPGRLLGSPFGWRIDPLPGCSTLHTGPGFQAEAGTAILAAAAASWSRRNGTRPAAIGTTRPEDRRGGHHRPIHRAAPAF
ncbi:hypothetical protein [Xylophilus sp.]|uniref:hypothetical protein n=1 Tax=Xylophilus sp. TaxID=2653893 RepID=UPI0013BCA73C|nr:hypothetical protein [Xylophilus sp.]KAF1047916.1 MAG: hypothetical protein GAK38_01626 [Xylophilus sp.]